MHVSTSYQIDNYDYEEIELWACFVEPPVSFGQGREIYTPLPWMHLACGWSAVFTSVNRRSDAARAAQLELRAGASFQASFRTRSGLDGRRKNCVLRRLLPRVCVIPLAKLGIRRR